MKIAFCLFKYFPYGGLQRDFVRIAQECLQRGHEIHVYTTEWQGEKIAGFNLHLFQVVAHQNHQRNAEFANQLQQALLENKCDAVIGFNKIPGLDLYYAADVCYQARAHEKHGLLYRLLPRFKQLASLEAAVFAKGKQTQILLIAPQQQAVFQQYYQTEDERFHLLPPGIARDRNRPANANQIRADLRATHQLTDENKLLLLIGSGFKTKGLDRAIHGLAALPNKLKTHTRLFVIGQDNPASFQKLAKKLGVEQQISLLGGGGR